MSVTLDILRTYRAPGLILRRRVAGPPSEARALAVLMAGCILMFVAQWPVLSRAAYQDPSIPLEARLVGAIQGWILIVPLFSYAVAAVSHLVARLFGGEASWYEARMALFWALLAASPLWLLNGLVAGFVGPGPALNGVGAIASLAFLTFWAAGLWAVERRTTTEI